MIQEFIQHATKDEKIALGILIFFGLVVLLDIARMYYLKSKGK